METAQDKVGTLDMPIKMLIYHVFSTQKDKIIAKTTHLRLDKNQFLFKFSDLNNLMSLISLRPQTRRRRTHVWNFKLS